MRPLFNAQALEAWKQVDADAWLSIVFDIMDSFFQSVDNQYGVLRSSESKGELREIGRAAHSLKSSFGNVGAERAHELLKSIEDAAIRGDAPGARNSLREFHRIFPTTMAELKAYRGGPPRT